MPEAQGTVSMKVQQAGDDKASAAAQRRWGVGGSQPVHAREWQLPCRPRVINLPPTWAAVVKGRRGRAGQQQGWEEQRLGVQRHRLGR